MFTNRMWLPKKKGRLLLRFTNDGIKQRSAVHISACEASELGSPPLGGDVQNWTTFIGLASITVQNVRPFDGFVEFYLFVDWGSPINLQVDITVFEPGGLVIGT